MSNKLLLSLMAVLIISKKKKKVNYIEEENAAYLKCQLNCFQSFGWLTDNWQSNDKFPNVDYTIFIL